MLVWMGLEGRRVLHGESRLAISEIWLLRLRMARNPSIRSLRDHSGGGGGKGVQRWGPPEQGGLRFPTRVKGGRVLFGSIPHVHAASWAPSRCCKARVRVGS